MVVKSVQPPLAWNCGYATQTTPVVRTLSPHYAALYSFRAENVLLFHTWVTTEGTFAIRYLINLNLTLECLPLQILLVQY